MNNRKLSIRNLVENTLLVERQGGFSDFEYRVPKPGGARNEFRFTPWDQDPNAIGVGPRTVSPAPTQPQVPPQVKAAQDDEDQEQSELGKTVDKYQPIADLVSLGLAFGPLKYFGGTGRVGAALSQLNKLKYLLPTASAAVDIAQGQYGDAAARALAASAYKVAPAPRNRWFTPDTSVVSAADAAAHATPPRAIAKPGFRKFLPDFIAGKLKEPVNISTAQTIATAGGKTINPHWYKLSRGAIPTGIVAANQYGAINLPSTSQVQRNYFGGSDPPQTTVQTATDNSIPGYGPDDARVAPSRRPKKKAPPQKQFEFEGRVWDENLAKGLHQQRRKDAMKRAIETGQPFVEPEPPKPVRIPKA